MLGRVPAAEPHTCGAGVNDTKPKVVPMQTTLKFRVRRANSQDRGTFRGWKATGAGRICLWAPRVCAYIILIPRCTLLL